MKLQFGGISILLVIYIAISSHSAIYSQGDNKYLTFSESYKPVSDAYIDIIIDPGHGGKDNGCIGSHIKEKSTVLEISRKLGEILAQYDPRIRVHYTRNSDRFISLVDRIKFANQIDGDLFISVHCNANGASSTSGSEVFVGGLEFVNAFDHTTHNQTSIIDEKTKAQLKQYELEKSLKMPVLKNSLDLATMVESEMQITLPYKSRGVKEEGFAVLKYIAMPGILVEAGFLTNRKEALYITSPQGQLNIANCIANGIKEYIEFNKLLHSYETSYTNSNSYVKNQTFKSQPRKKRYSVEIASTKSRPLMTFDNKWDHLDSIQIVKKDGNYHYRIGDFRQYENAQIELTKLKNIGFEKAFIIGNSSSKKDKDAQYTGS